ncbi:hypothetical protein DMR_09570 [Solidesulfovibrio magneticus RS-1]|uniref:Uncharacterized protein n=1 Tax=Solidesulfovibrio magneticus (strain ATCC 700980 / DSM 13731 / RS-1) TaxID=573370 RepID=C4XKQ7_SOLM1|nr:hypothetical protein DMR_09570 [Solidesulfovibrio magneticus RS-1]
MQYDLSPIRTTLPVHPPLLTEVDHLRLDRALWKKDVGCRARFPGIWPGGNPKAPATGKIPGQAW